MECSFYLEKRLISYVQEQMKEGWIKSQKAPSAIFNIVDKINPDALLVGLVVVLLLTTSTFAIYGP
jgi:hypothetical protein